VQCVIRLLLIGLQLCGASATIHFTTAACHCGSNRITDVHSASRSGLSSELENNLWHLQYCVISSHSSCI